VEQILLGRLEASGARVGGDITVAGRIDQNLGTDRLSSRFVLHNHPGNTASLAEGRGTAGVA